MIFVKIADLFLIFGDMMRFLLVNANSAVKKIFNITAKKAGIELDLVDSIKNIPLDKDYGCIFVDDGVSKTGDISNFKSKMMATKFCIILSKDSPLVSGFDSYIRKPFLPTDIYDVLKKEKYSELNSGGDSGESIGDLDANSNTSSNTNSDIDLSEFSDSEDEFLSGTKESKDIDFSGNPLGNDDLSSDSGDSSANVSDVGADLNIASVSNVSDLNVNASNTSNDLDANTASASNDFEIPSAFDLDSVDLEHLSDSNTTNANLDAVPNPTSTQPQNVPLDLDSINLDTPKANQAPHIDQVADIAPPLAPIQTPPQTPPQPTSIATQTPPTATNAPQTPPPPQAPQVDNVPPPTPPTIDTQSTSPAIADDIDFSQIMAMQNDFLQAQEQEEKTKKKPIIGGDIYKPKGDSSTQPQSTTQDLANDPKDLAPVTNSQSTQQDLVADLQTIPQDSIPQDSVSQDLDKDIASQPQDSQDSMDVMQDLAQESAIPQNDIALDLAQNAPDNLGAETEISNAIDLAPNIDLAQANTIDLANAPQDTIPKDTIDLAPNITQDLPSPSVNANATSTDLPQNADIDFADSTQNAPKNADDDFLESLDFLKDPEPTKAQNSENIIDMTQDLPPQDFTSQNPMSNPPQEQMPTQSQNYEEYSLDNVIDSMAKDGFVSDDGLDNLSGISDIVSQKSKQGPKDNNDILNNLEIIPDMDYHVDMNMASNATKDITNNANTADEQNNNFNSAFSNGISAEMDSISPNFTEQGFIQDLTLGSDTDLPDFSKSLKQHTTSEQRYNMLGLPLDESGDVKNINDLSKNELESLDDEAILLLQEKSLKQKNTPPNTSKVSPKVLDKQQIDDITNILETTQKPIKSPQKPSSIAIHNDEFGSLTQEALSEVLGEESPEKDEFESSADFINMQTPNVASVANTPNKQSTTPSLNQNININLNSQTASIQENTIPKQINLSNMADIDIAKLLQTFPIDKLRELLSGVQITVNITFPTKKQ